MTRPAIVAGGFALAMVIFLTGTSAGESPSGEAEKVAQSARANQRTLEVNGEIFMGDEIRTGPTGEAQIRFVDDTRMVVGPSARVMIDRFVYSGSTARSVTLNMVKGAFRFITGKSPKRAYQIRTPTIAVGVRGTGLDGFVEAGSGRTTIALYEGAARACTRANQCVDMQAGCTIIVAAPGGGFEQPDAATIARFLPYAASQASLLPQYRLNTSGCRTNAAPALRTPTRSSEGTAGGGSRGGGEPRGGGRNR